MLGRLLRRTIIVRAMISRRDVEIEAMEVF
jgi:hypothetical protein